MNKAQAIAVGVTLLGASVLGYGLYRVGTAYLDFGTASGELDAAVAAYRADGLPFVAAEVAPPRLDDAHNAAPAIQAARKALPAKGVKTRLDAALRKTDAKADAVVALYAPALAKVADAPDRVEFVRDWDLGPVMLFPEYAGMKTLAKAAALRADRAAARGDDASALRDLTTARQIALWAGQEPTLISLLVRIAAERIALDGAERCLAHAAGHPERIARYDRWVKKAPPLPDFGVALRGEAWMGVTTMRNLGQFGGMDALTKLQTDEDAGIPKVDPARLQRDGLPDGVTARGFLARHLQLWDRIYRETGGFRQPPRAIGARLDTMENRLEGKRGLSYVLERILLPVFGQAGEAVVTLDARRAVAAGLAEELTTHALTGRWPTRISIKDPFTGEPLRVKQTKEGVRVYSVGRDGKDDGGRLRREAPKTEGATYDEVAAYPPIPR